MTKVQRAMRCAISAYPPCVQSLRETKLPHFNAGIVKDIFSEWPKQFNYTKEDQGDSKQEEADAKSWHFCEIIFDLINPCFLRGRQHRGKFQIFQNLERLREAIARIVAR